MPITINGSTDYRVGVVSTSMAAFTSDFDGTHAAPGNNAGSFNFSIGGFAAALEGQYAASANFDGSISATLSSFIPRLSTTAQAASRSVYFAGNAANDQGRIKIPAGAESMTSNFGAGDVTVEMWIRPASSGNNRGVQTQGPDSYWTYGNIFFDHAVAFQDPSFGISLGGGRVHAGCQDQSGNRYTVIGTNDLRDDQWHHIAVERDISTGYMSLYVDGVRDQYVNAGITDSMQHPDDLVHVAWCGASETEDCAQYDDFIVLGAEKADLPLGDLDYTGYMAELRISDTLRYDASTYTIPVDQFSPDGSTAALYHFDEGTGTSVTDYSGNGNTGSVESDGVGPTWQTDGPFVSSWSGRSTAPGVVQAYALDTSAEVSSLTTGDSRAADVVFDQTIHSRGNGCARINVPDFRDENAGSLRMYLRSDQAFFGDGDDYWMQVSCLVPRHMWQYKPQGAGGFKLFILSYFLSSNQNNEIVANNSLYRGFLQAYHQNGSGFVGFEEGISTPSSSGNIRYQGAIDTGTPASPSTDAEYAQRYGPLAFYTPGEFDPANRPGGASSDAVDVVPLGHPNSDALVSGAFDFPVNRWFSVKVHVQIGTLGTASSQVDFWAATLGDSYTHIISETGVTLGTANGGHNGLHLTPYDTGRVADTKGMDSYIAYKDVIVSTDDIVAPASEFPAWRENAISGRWMTLSTSIDDVNPDPGGTSSYRGNSGHGSVCTAWNGAVASPDSLIIGAAGGDQDYGGNEVYELDLSADSPAWSREVEPATSLNLGGSYHGDGSPNCGHNYDHQVFIPPGVTNGNRLFQPLRYSLYNGVNSTIEAASWVRGTSSWDAQDTFLDFPANATESAAVAWDSQGGYVWVAETLQGQGMFRFDPASNTWTSYSNNTADNFYSNTSAIDPYRRCMVVINSSEFWVYDLEDPAATPIQPTVTGSGPSINAPGLVFHPPTNCFIAWGGGQALYRLVPGTNWRTDSWAWESITIAPGGDTPTSGVSGGTFGRFNWIERLDTFVVVNGTTQDTYLFPSPVNGLWY